MRVGVIGCGYWGSKHVRVLHQIDTVDELAVIDSRAGRLAELTRSFPKATGFTSLDAALDGLDALVVATPPRTHHRLAAQALDAGVHTLVEKPMATSTADARDLVARAAAAGCTLMVGHTFEYNAAVWKLRELIDDGELGHVHYIDSARLNLGLYQPDVNVIWDLAPHDVSIANYLLRSRPTTVRVWGSSHARPVVEDVAYVGLDYEEIGVTVQIHVSWLDPCKVRRMTVVGSDKMAVYNDLHDETRLRIYDKGVVLPDGENQLHGVPTSYRNGAIHSPFIPFNEPLLVQDEHFLSTFTLGHQPLSDGRVGMDVVCVLEAAERALREQRTVRVDEISPERALAVADVSRIGAVL